MKVELNSVQCSVFSVQLRTRTREFFCVVTVTKCAGFPKTRRITQVRELSTFPQAILAMSRSFRLGLGLSRNGRWRRVYCALTSTLIVNYCVSSPRPLALAPAARTQMQDDGLQPYYWPNRTVGIPVNVDQISKLANKPSDLQLYYAINHGPFQKSLSQAPPE